MTAQYYITKIEPCGVCKGVGDIALGHGMAQGCFTCDRTGEIVSQVLFADFAQTPKFQSILDQAIGKNVREFSGSEGFGH